MSRYKRSTIRYTLDPGSRVDVWHRFSGAAQDDASALAAIERYCAQHDLTIERTWGRPATSGSVITGTREFLDFVAAMEAHPEAERRRRGIVIWRLNRLGRDQVEGDYFVAHLRRLGYAIVSVADPVTDTDIQPVLEAVTRWKDQRFLEELSEDVKRTMQWLRDAGSSTGGRPPRGFIALREENRERPRRHNGEKRINARWVRGGPDEAATSLAWRMKVEGATDREIHAATRLLKDVHCYHDMWRRPCYAAAGYVSPQDWQRVQETMDARAFADRHPRRLGSAYLLSGLLVCTCGRPMTGWSSPRGHGPKRTDSYHPGPDAFSYYRCMAAKRGEGCAMTGMLRAEAVEDAVLAAITQDIITPESLARLRERLGEDLRRARQSTDGELGVLRRRHAELGAAIRRLTAAVEEGGDVAVLVAALRERSAEAQLVKRALADAEERRREQDPLIMDDAAWAGLVAWLGEGLASEDVVQRRRVLESIVRRVTLWPERDGVTIHYALTPGSGLRVVSPHGGRHRPDHSITLSLDYPCRLLRGASRLRSTEA